MIEAYQLLWHITRLGCRGEYWFQPAPPRDGSEANASMDEELVSCMHLAALNQGIMLTPFHNMAWISPDTTKADIDFHTQLFSECLEAMAG